MHVTHQIVYWGRETECITSKTVKGERLGRGNNTEKCISQRGLVKTEVKAWLRENMNKVIEISPKIS